MKRRTGTLSVKSRAAVRTRLTALLWAALLVCMPATAPAMQILEAVDHAELEAEISNRAVSRIALVGDRIARVIRGPDGFVVEHDAARGDVYLRPADGFGVRFGGGVPREPLTLFVGTAGGFTYRLALTAADRGSAQILIRNAAAASGPDLLKPGDGRVAALAALVRAVARREPLPGYTIEAAAGERSEDGLAVVEIWRGPRFTARVLEADAGSDADARVLAGRLAPDTAAVWAAPRGSGPMGGRLVVAVADAFKSGFAEARQ